MFAKILIANRGEIACRIMATARRMGIATVAVYSEADRNSAHVAMADEAYLIGPAPARDSYLKGKAIIDVALRSGAEAIHPGYGFLSENSGFARACVRSNVVFIGPPAKVIRDMGSKKAARAIMEKAGVPVVPGYHGAQQGLSTFRRHAGKIGYPVLVKASAGGGGKGMRIVDRAEQLADAVRGAGREAKSAFGDGSLLLERYLTNIRHVEVQIFADSKGNIVHLLDRDCSVQRRHQKVIEEAPAPGVAPDIRRQMGDAAIAAARAVGYVGAGTVEFLYDHAGKAFYFIEMNTRLQVEHRVTEMITGLDLVEWQFRVAAGETIPWKQGDITPRGHGFEARIYAEDPSQDFRPASGTLARFCLPRTSEDVIIDTGVREGDTITPHYDPMIAKVVVKGADRASALRQLRSALRGVRMAGVVSNVDFLARVVAHSAFSKARISTSFIETYRRALLTGVSETPDRALALAVLFVELRRVSEARVRHFSSVDMFSPWGSVGGWRLNEDPSHVLEFKIGDEIVSVTVHIKGEGYVFDLPDVSLKVSGTLGDDGDLTAEIDGVYCKAMVVQTADVLTVMTDGGHDRIRLSDPQARIADLDDISGHLVAPMPGRIVDIRARAGVKVVKGDVLVVVEAMKMEHSVTAPWDGMVEAIYHKEGDQVEEGVDLVLLRTEEAEN